MPAGKPMQTRFFRSQQDLKAKMLERQALGDDQSTNQVGQYMLCFNVCVSVMLLSHFVVMVNFELFQFYTVSEKKRG